MGPYPRRREACFHPAGLILFILSLSGCTSVDRIFAAQFQGDPGLIKENEAVAISLKDRTIVQGTVVTSSLNGVTLRLQEGGERTILVEEVESFLVARGDSGLTTLAVMAPMLYVAGSFLVIGLVWLLVKLFTGS